MIKTKKLMVAAIASVAMCASAMDLMILNTGSKTGGFSVESAAYAQDLAKAHKVDFVSPGQFCAAYGVLTKTTTPVLFPWASDFEALGRDGKGCATLSVKPEQIVRSNLDPMYVCSMKPAFTAKAFVQPGASSRVGHTTPAFAFSRVVQAVNESFKTTHKSVVYDGTGSAKVALYNGEIDYGFFSAKWVKEIEENKGQCHYVLSDKDSKGYPALSKLDTKNPRLYSGYATLWVLLNADAKTTQSIRQQIRELHADPASAIQRATHGTLDIDWDKDKSAVIADWERAVGSMRQ